MAKAKGKEREASSGERIFMHFWNIFGDLDYPYQRELIFHPERDWRFDFAWLQQKVACEIEGGAFSGGRHTRGAGFSEDILKHNQAVLLGWRLLRFTPQQLEADPETCIGQVLQLLRPPVRTTRGDVCQCAKFVGNELNCEMCGGYMF